MNVSNNSIQQGQLYNSYSNYNTMIDDTQDTIEGFSGAFGDSKVLTTNLQEDKETQTIRKQFDKALSEYGKAQKQLMDDTSTYINNATSSGQSTSLRNNLIRMNNGTVGYVTDKNKYLHIPSTDVLQSIQGKNGCPDSITEVDFVADNYTQVGSTLGTRTDIQVGNPMQMNQSCVPTSVNLQVLGASDPTFNKADWLGCYKSDDTYFDRQRDLSGITSADNAIQQCHHRSSDIGSSTFYIDTNTDNSYSCFTSKPGMTTVQIQNTMKPGYIKQVSGVVHTNSTFPYKTNYKPSAGIMNNGQIAIGNLTMGSDNFGNDVQDAIFLANVSGLDTCDPIYGANIRTKTANYGSNCNGLQDVHNSSAVYDVAPNNWMSVINSAIQATDSTSAVSVPIYASPDPARGCAKVFSSTYSCGTNPSVKSISIDKEASGHSAIYDCTKESVQCMSGALTIGDDGNVVLTINGSILYQSETQQVGLSLEEYKAVNGKYGRNSLKTGEYLLPNEFIGSPSGKCALMCVDDGKGTVSLKILYFVLGCNKPGEVQDPSTSSGENGFVATKPNISAMYSLEDGPVSNEDKGKVVYSDDNMNRKDYPSSMLNMGNTYVNIGNYDQPSKSIQVIDNSNLDDCKTRCNDISDCYGFVYYENENKCNLRNAKDMFPMNTQRVLNEDAQMFIRQFKIANPSTCSDDIMNTTGNIFNNMVEGEAMDSNTLCDLGKAMTTQMNDVSMKETQLLNAMQGVNKGIKKLNHQNKTLLKDTKQSINRMNDNSLTYKQTIDKMNDTTNQIDSVNAMDENTQRKMQTQNTQFIVWTTIASLAVILLIKIAK